MGKKNSIAYIWKDRKRILGMPISFTRYALSEDRLFLQTGFLNSHYYEILLYRVRDISLTRSLGQKLFGVGTITVQSSDATNPSLVIKNVKASFAAKELLHRQVEAMKLARRVRIGELMGEGSLHGEDDDLYENAPEQ